jgi:hypothetical protein
MTNLLSDCLVHIEKALGKQNDYLRGLVVKDAIFRQNPYLENLTRDMFAKFSSSTYDSDRAKEVSAVCIACGFL